MIQLDQKYDREHFLGFLREAFLKDFAKDVRPVGVDNFKAIKKAYTLGSSSDLDLQVFEFEYSGSFNKRIALAKEAFQVMKQSATFQALAIFYSPVEEDWRFSLMTANPQRTEKGNITVAYSNPRRYSFFLGPHAKTNTPTKFLIKKGMVVDFEDLKSRFSLEVVNKEFYKEIAECYTKLVGGTRGEGRNKKTFEPILKLPSVNDHSQTSIEFAVRLIGRIIFCWFLREKISESGSSLMPKELLSLQAISNNSDYYHRILEPIFFEVLNKPINSRKDAYRNKEFSKIPYLNGGLFSPHDDDYFSYNEGKQAQNHNTVIVPDDWFNELFQILETYNFTIDENTSIDEELSIDPEMLGRIFENLLAEINPETGESARKSTGSYYTPRVIVDYMVDESLLLYLKQKTSVEENKLKAIISYDLSDDALYPLNETEKKSVVDAIEKVKILDPACGSGAFPIGALQKIVFILQQIDPDGQIWFHKQIQHTSPEIRRVIEREFSHENFDYIRKLGIIRENIYGIDIQPIATEIARLRCFLTLVVDERIDEALENRGIQPLPNLDFKFVTANSLIGLPKLSAQGELFDDNNKIDELKELRDRYFNARDEERKDLMLAFSDLQSEMINALIDKHSWAGVAKAELTRKLTDWKPFKHRSTDWFDPEWMFGIKNGFDIVIANPPYLGEKGHKELFQQIANSSLGKYYKRRMDLFYFFFHLGLNLCAEGGLISYISTNYYLTADGAIKLRTDFKERATIYELINFDELKIFESALGQHNMITIISKVRDLSINAMACSTQRTGFASVDQLYQILTRTDEKTNYRYQKQTDLYDGVNLYMNTNLTGETNSKFGAGVIEKIRKNGIELKNFCRVESGIQTSIDKISNKHIQKYPNLNLVKGEGVFVLNISEKEHLMNESNKQFFYKWYKNSDIEKYHANIKKDNQEFVIYLKDQGKAIKLDPALENHFKKFKEILIDIKKNCFKNEWLKHIVEPWLIRGNYFVLFYPRNLNMFLGPKIIAPYRSKINKFAYNDVEWFGSIDLTFITSKNDALDLKYILSILNSKLIYYWLSIKGKKKGSVLELYPRPLSEIPIKKISVEEQRPLVEIVNKILEITTSEEYLGDLDKKSQVEQFEKQIDQIVYKLYDLDDNEINVVEGLNE